MKKSFMKKCIAGSLALCVCSGAASVSNNFFVNDDLTACALNWLENQDISFENDTFMYHKVKDHIELHSLVPGFSGTEVEIPEEIDGLPVTVIGDQCFSFRDKLTSITIPNTVKLIKAGAFDACTSLESIVIPDSVVEIEGSAFLHCEKLEKAVLSKNLTTIGQSAFECCFSLAEVNIPDKLTEIPYCAFLRCESLETVVVPKSVKYIDIFAFGKCKKLKSVTIENPDCEFNVNKNTINNDSEKEIVYNGKICGYKGSTAEEFANECGYKFEALSGSPEPDKPAFPVVYDAAFGDVNGDGSIDSSDASLVLVEYSSLSTGGGSLFTESMTKAADVNKDGTVDSSDASLILAYYSYISTGGVETDMEKWADNK